MWVVTEAVRRQVRSGPPRRVRRRAFTRTSGNDSYRFGSERFFLESLLCAARSVKRSVDGRSERRDATSERLN